LNGLSSDRLRIRICGWLEPSTIDFRLLLYNIISNENDENKADDDDYSDDLAFQNQDDALVDCIIAGESAQEVDVSE
jgi:hypothetical protein